MYASKMHHARAVLTVLSLLAGAALTYRVWRASTFGVFEAATSLTTAALLTGAMGFGWAIHVRRVRAENAAEARQKVIDLNADDEADRALWDSIPPAKIDEDTIAFGQKVVPLDRYRYPRAG